MVDCCPLSHHCGNPKPCLVLIAVHAAVQRVVREQLAVAALLLGALQLRVKIAHLCDENESRRGDASDADGGEEQRREERVVRKHCVRYSAFNLYSDEIFLTWG